MQDERLLQGLTTAFLSFDGTGRKYSNSHTDEFIFM